jgi:hypothetical protein
LYLRKGKWGNKQIISQKWVEESTKAHSRGEGGEGYGYLWWTVESLFKSNGLYYAAGSGGHKIFVLPKDELVIVLRVDTYNNKYVSRELSFKLVSQILEAKTSLPREKPILAPLELSHDNSKSIQPSINTSLMLDKYVGRYQFEDEWMDIIKTNKGLILHVQFMGKFPIKPITDNLFFVEDAQKYLYFILDKNYKPVELIYHHDSKKGPIQSKK